VVKTSVIWIFVAMIGALLWLHLPSIVVPFLLAFILAYAMNPMMLFLHKRMKIPRSISAIFLLLLFIFAFTSFMLVLVPLVYSQIAILVKKIPLYKDFVNDTFIPYVLVKLESVDSNIAQSAKETVTQSVDDIFAIFVRMLNNVWSYTLATINALIMAFLVPVLLFYFLRDLEHMKKSFYEFFPKNTQSLVKSIFSDINKVLSGYFRGQLLVCLFWGVYYYIALTIIGLDLAFILAIISGIAPIVPIIGGIIAVISTLLVGFFTFGAGPELIYIIGAYAFGAILDNTIITPKIIGDSVGLSPVWIVFSVLAMSYILGPIGLLIGIPIAGIISVIFKYASRNYKESELYNKKK
jgi:predicted PurR-regulated permease PerM